MTPHRLLCLLVLPALLLGGEASAKDKRDGAAKATENSAIKQPASRTPNVKPEWSKNEKNDRPGGFPGPYPNRQAR